MWLRGWKGSWKTPFAQRGNNIGSFLFLLNWLQELVVSTHCNTRCSLQALHLPAYRNSTSFPDPCCDTRARLPALPVHPTRLNYLQFYSSSCSDGLAAGKRKKKKKITSPPTLSVQFCCSCYLYVNHQLMNNMTCIAAPGCCSLHKSVIMSDVSRQHDSISFVLFFYWLTGTGPAARPASAWQTWMRFLMCPLRAQQ